MQTRLWGVLAYLFGVSFFTTWHEPPAPRSIRGLSSAQLGPAERWQRRERMYWMLTGLALISVTRLPIESKSIIRPRRR